MRMPLLLYRRGWGWLLDHTFLLINAQAPRDGCDGAEVRPADPGGGGLLGVGFEHRLDPQHPSAPGLSDPVGRESYTPEQRFLSEDESVTVAVEFRRRHPMRSRILATTLGWGDLGSEAAVREFVRSRPFVSFRPAHPSGPAANASSRACGDGTSDPRGKR